MSDGQGSGGDPAGYLGWFFLGAILGAAAAFVLAPRTGSETRELLKEKSSEFTKRAGEFAGEAQVKAGDFFDKGRDFLEEQTRRFRSAFEAGRQAMKEEMSNEREDGSA
ncbi:MAG: YtxH domain-containing protein [Candidatus Methylomirabilia bacterium]